MMTAISIAGLASVIVGFAAFSLSQLAEWQRLLTAHADIQVPVRIERQIVGLAL